MTITDKKYARLIERLQAHKGPGCPASINKVLQLLAEHRMMVEALEFYSNPSMTNITVPDEYWTERFFKKADEALEKLKEGVEG